MTGCDVHVVADALGRLPFSLDGGWGVDALLGEQTRQHSDLDIAIAADLVDAAARRLSAHGFAPADAAMPGLPARYVLRDERGRQVDFHLLVFDRAGDGWQVLPDGSRASYPRADLGYQGVVAGRIVRCISPELQLRHHLGYDPQARDLRDMRLLAKRFGLELPEPLETRA